jgi:alpha-L-fucosidase
VFNNRGQERRVLAQEDIVRTLLGSDAPVKWTRSSDGLGVDLPAQRPCDYAFVLRIE